MKHIKHLIAAAALFTGTFAMAAPVAGADLQNAINGLYTAAGTSTSLAPNVNLNQASEGGIFFLEAAGGGFSTLAFQWAGLSSSYEVGLYDPYSSATVTIFAGNADSSLASADGTRTIQVASSVSGGVRFRSMPIDGEAPFDLGVFKGNNFGYYLKNGSQTIYSEASRNADLDLFVAYQGDGDLILLPGSAPASNWLQNSYLFAFDLNDGANEFNDFGFYATNLKVPEPGSIALLGLGLAGLAAASRRKGKKA